MANFLSTTYSAKVSDAICKMENIIITVDHPPTPKKDPVMNLDIISSMEEYNWKENYRLVRADAPSFVALSL